MYLAKMSFFVWLQETFGRVARGDLLIVMGDMNACKSGR